jgi:hypothetical protein
MHLRTVLRRLLAAALLAGLLPLPAASQDFPDRDAREIGAYVLTEAGLAKYVKATTALGRLAQQATNDCDSEGAASLDEAAARFNAVPGVRTAIQSAGMTTREYLVFTFSLFQNGMASWALSQPGGKLPPDTSKANVDFYRAHEAAIQKLGVQGGDDDCDDRDEETEDQ